MSTETLEQTDIKHNLQERLAAREQAKVIPEVQAVIVAPPIEQAQSPVVKEPEEVKTETPEAATPAVPIVEKSWEEKWNGEAKVQEPNPEAEAEKGFLSKYQQDLEIADFAKTDPLAKALYENRNDPNFDLNAWIDSQRTDYSKLPIEDRLRALVAHNKLDWSEDDIKAELESYNGKSKLEQSAIDKTILDSLPKPTDVKANVSKYAAAKKEQADKVDEWATSTKKAIKDFALSKVGIDLDGTPTTKEEMESIANSILDHTHYWKDKNVPTSYDYTREVQDRLFAKRYREQLGNIKKEAKEQGKIEAVQERQNASKNDTVHNNSPQGLTEDQIQRRKVIETKFATNPARRDAALKSEGLIK